MKKLILLIVLLVAFTLPAQVIYNLGNGILVSDTLYQTSATVSDTLEYIPLNYDYEWLNITVSDTGSSLTDSLVVEYPTHNYTLKSGTTRRWEISDTTWSSVHFMRDSTWTNVNVMAKSNGTASYKIHVGDYLGVRIRMTNVQVVANRACWYKAQSVRKK